MTLAQWEQNGWLVARRFNTADVADLFAIIERDLRDASIRRLSTDWKLNIAYNAALQAANLALAVKGYEPARDAHHYRAIASLELTLSLDQALISRLDGFRQMRNTVGYDKPGQVSTAQAGEMYLLALDLRDRLIDWLQQHHPDWLPAAYRGLWPRVRRFLSRMIFRRPRARVCLAI